MTKARDTANLTGSGVTLPLLDIDAGTDIGAALVDADLMIVDDGAGGTNRKATMSRLATYMGTKIGGGMEFLASSGAISDAATVVFNQFDASKYDYYIFNILAVVPVGDNTRLLMQLSADGTNYDTTSGNYHSEGGDQAGLLLSSTNVGGASGDTLEGINVKGSLYNVSNSSKPTVLNSQGGYLNTSNNYVTWSSASNYEASTAAHTAVRFLFNALNIESGEITMFGIVNS